jgi:hypothetical protein
VIGYDGFGLSEGTETVIPAAQGKLGGITYIQEVKAYDPGTGQLDSYEDSAAGGLPQEIIGYSYDDAGDPTSDTSAIWGYVGSLSYTDLGQPQEYAYGPDAAPAWTVDSYDEQTGALTRQLTEAGTAPVAVDDQNYGYDNTGQVTSDADTPAAGQRQVQCFQYDYLGRLSQAWSQGGSSCASGPSQPAESGAAAPYWEQFSYDAVDDMTSRVSTPASGSAVTTADAYPAAGRRCRTRCPRRRWRALPAARRRTSAMTPAGT